MGHAPDTVNYKGEVLTDDMKKYLYGDTDITGVPKGGGLPADRAAEILNNWMFGFKPTPIDPGETLTKESRFTSQIDRAAAGMGMGGAFGFGNYIGSPTSDLQGIQDLGNSPMAPGVPYKVPPLPTLNFNRRPTLTQRPAGPRGNS